MPTATTRKSRFPRTEDELRFPLGTDTLDDLRLGIDYREVNGKYLFTEKVFSDLEARPHDADPATAVDEQSNVGAEPVPEGNSAPAPYLGQPPGVEVNKFGEVTPPLSALSRFGTPPSFNAPNERRLTVLQLLPNPRMVIARSAEHGTLNHHVQVGDSTNFVHGMPLNAVPHPQESAFWKLVGTLPRTKGRW